MYRAAWVTDIHLNFVDAAGRSRFCEVLRAAEPDLVLIGGDIGHANSVATFLAELETAVARPIAFVLGNHDFYGGSIPAVRAAVAQLARVSRHLTYLSESDAVQLTPETCVVGHDGWGDARLGDIERSAVMLNDFMFIAELARLRGPALWRHLNQLGDEAAQHLARVLPAAAAKYRHVLVLTHVPPFRASCWHEGTISADDYLPFFGCRAVGDVLQSVADCYPDCRFTVLCGHTHSPAEACLRDNLSVWTGGADYGFPRIERVVEV